MQYYKEQRNYYCEIDLHARTMYLCILDSKGNVKLHKNLKTSPDALKKAIKPYLDNLVIAVECMFSYYWIADFCEDNNIEFILLYISFQKG